MTMTRLEKETLISFNEEEPLATVTTFNSRVIARLSQLEGALLVKEYGEGEKRFTIPKAWIRFNPPRKVRLNDEQIEERRARIATLNRSKATGEKAKHEQ